MPSTFDGRTDLKNSRFLICWIDTPTLPRFNSAFASCSRSVMSSNEALPKTLPRIYRVKIPWQTVDESDTGSNAPSKTLRSIAAQQKSPAVTGLKSFSQILGALAVSGFQDQSHKPLDHLSRGCQVPRRTPNNCIGTCSQFSFPAWLEAADTYRNHIRPGLLPSAHPGRNAAVLRRNHC